MKPFLILVLLAIVIVGSMICTVSVEETDFAIVTRFGKPVRILEEAGLAFKLPWPIETVTRVDRRLQVFDPPRASATENEHLTGDKKQVVVDCFSVWRVKDPLAFVKQVVDKERAEALLDDLIRSEVGTRIARYDLTAFLPASGGLDSERSSAMTNEMQPFMDSITRDVAAAALSSFGIEVLSVRMKRLSFPDQNKGSVFTRMREERQRISGEIREKGRTEGDKIRADANLRKEQILAEARKEAERIRAEADAMATRIYDGAYRQAPELFRLQRKLDFFEYSLGPDDWFMFGRDTNWASILDVIPGDMPLVEGPTKKAAGEGATGEGTTGEEAVGNASRGEDVK